MKNNKIIPFSLLFITLTFLELFCIVKYSDIFYFPLAVGATLLGSAYLLLAEIQASVTSFLKDKDKSDEINTDDNLLAEKEEASKLARATYVLEKRILNLLEERILMPEENIENQSALQREVINAIKASIKYERENTKHLADVISINGNTADNSMEPGDLSRILAKFDSLALELKSNQLTMAAVKEQLQTITDIARQISNSKMQYMSQATTAADTITTNTLYAPEYADPGSEEVFNEPVIDAEPLIEETSYNEETTTEFLGEEVEPAAEETSPESVKIATTSEIEDNLEEMPEFVDTLTVSKPAESVPAVDDPNRQMSPDDIAALFAASEPELKPAPAPVVDDPNKQMSPDDIAALFASTNLELEPEPSAPAPKTAIETLSKSTPEIAPVSDDPNKKMSPEDIAALFASAGQ